MKCLLVCLAAFASCISAADSWSLSTDDTATVVAVEQGRPVLKRLGVPGNLPHQLVAFGCAGNSASCDWVARPFNTNKLEIPGRLSRQFSRETYAAIYQCRSAARVAVDLAGATGTRTHGALANDRE